MRDTIAERREDVAPIPWSATRRLHWSDFRGLPEPGNDASALTGYQVSYESECTGDAFTFRVESQFLPDRSWVKPSVLLRGLGSEQLLRHEQRHFDLSEVYARRIRQALDDAVDPCHHTPADRYAIVEQILRADSESQDQYDRETSYGLDSMRQAAWEADIERQLASLESYAQKTTS